MTTKTSPVPWVTPHHLEALRESLDLSWVKLADQIGISYMTLLRMRDGRSHGHRLTQKRIREMMIDRHVINERNELTREVGL